MSQASAIMDAAQALFAQEFPATVKIGPQSYAAGTGGMRSQAQLAAGGFEQQRALSFWLPSAAFATAGQPVPQAPFPITCTAPAALAGEYLITEVLPDGTGTNLTLRCTAPPQ